MAGCVSYWFVTHRIRLLISSVSGHLQIGGGITADNAREWLDAGANKAGPPVRLAVAFDADFGRHRVHVQVIVTSYLFPDGKFSLERLQAISSAAGKDRLVVDVR